MFEKCKGDWAGLLMFLNSVEFNLELFFLRIRIFVSVEFDINRPYIIQLT